LKIPAEDCNILAANLSPSSVSKLCACAIADWSAAILNKTHTRSHASEQTAGKKKIIEFINFINNFQENFVFIQQLFNVLKKERK
jgi:hypothetical protein